MPTTPATNLFSIVAQPVATPRLDARTTPPTGSEASFPAQLQAEPANSGRKPESSPQVEDHQQGSHETFESQSSSGSSQREGEEPTREHAAEPSAGSTESNTEQEQPTPPASVAEEPPVAAATLLKEEEQETPEDVPPAEAVLQVVVQTEAAVVAETESSEAVKTDISTTLAPAAETLTTDGESNRALAAAGNEAADAPLPHSATNNKRTSPDAPPLSAPENVGEVEPKTLPADEHSESQANAAAAKTADATVVDAAGSILAQRSKSAEQRNNASEGAAETEAAPTEALAEQLPVAKAAAAESEDQPKRRSHTPPGGGESPVAAAADKPRNQEVAALPTPDAALAFSNASSELNDRPASEVVSGPQDRSVESPAPATAAEAVVGAPNRTEGVASRASQALFGTSHRADAARLNQAEQTRFVHRVSNALRSANQRQDSEIRLRLSPPELGALKLQVKVEQGALVATLEAETHVARDLLMEHLPVLRERLAEQEIRIETFDVHVSDREANAEQQSNAQQHHSRGGNANHKRDSIGEEQEQATAAAPSIRRDDGLLDVVV